MYDFSDSRVNPAYSSVDSYWKADLIHRRQNTGTEYGFETNNIEVSVPFLNSKRAWSGFNAGFLNDQTSGNSIYKLNSLRVGYSINVPLRRLLSISFGIQTSYSRRSFNSLDLSTGAQFIEYRGFDTGLPSGETFGVLNQTDGYLGLDAGIIIRKLTRRKYLEQEIGLSVYNINNPTITNGALSESVEPVLLATYKRVIYQELRLKILPEALINLNKNGNLLLAGARFQYFPDNITNEERHLDLVTKFSTNSELICAVQYQMKNLSFGFNYDVAIFNKNVVNSSAFEIAIGFRNKKNLKKAKVQEEQDNNIPHFMIERLDPLKPLESKGLQSNGKINKVTIQPADDSIIKEAKTGKFSFLSHVVESPSYTFNFGFDETQLSKTDISYLSTIVEILKDNKQVKIDIIGHTDDVGSSNYNYKLGLERGRIVQKYLLKNKVDANQINLISKGETQPLKSNSTENGRSANRRVELKLTF
jgi:type IX secretion system PorP/SprF family membrane protein